VSEGSALVSVIVPTYRPGSGLDRVIRSLDEQTMPREAFEVIFVDDGSGDDTVGRLREIAATRPNVRVAECEHSGWSGRPRNVGTDLAVGEYVLFMDHDDSLYPDGLRRAYAYAQQTGADIVSPKESKTSDSWWGLPHNVFANVPDIRRDGGIANLIPMVPHKLYRRSLLVEHNVRFPEGERSLWEDWYINIGAYRHAGVVAVLADTPVYLWHASPTNTSHSFDPARPDYWDRLDDMLAFASATFDRPEDRESLDVVLAHNLRLRVVDRCLHSLVRKSASTKSLDLVVRRSKELLHKYGSDGVLSRLPRKHQIQAHLLRAGQTELMKAYHAADLSLGVKVTARSPYWRDGSLHYQTEVRWAPAKTGQAVLVAKAGRVMRRVSPPLESAIPPELLDVTDVADTGDIQMRVAIRDRLAHVSWPLQTTLLDSAYMVDDGGSLCFLQRGEGVVSLGSAALGNRLTDSVWDLAIRAGWDGMIRRGELGYDGDPLPVIDGRRTAVAYSNQRRGLSLDVGQHTRTLLTDAAPRTGYAGPIGAFCTPVENLAASGDVTLPIENVVAIPEGAIPPGIGQAKQTELREELAGTGGLGAELVVEAGRGVLRGGADLSAGTDTLFARRSGQLQRTRYVLRVDETGHAHFNLRS